MRIADLRVDPSDELMVAEHHWYVTSNGYVAHAGVRGGQRTVFYLHRVLMGEPAGAHVDHINANKLDNRRENLRVATYRQNQANRHCLNSNNRSGARGVWFHAKSSRWHARISVDHRSIHLGSFGTLAEAIDARHAAEPIYFGERCPA